MVNILIRIINNHISNTMVKKYILILMMRIQILLVMLELAKFKITQIPLM